METSDKNDTKLDNLVLHTGPPVYQTNNPIVLNTQSNQQTYYTSHDGLVTETYTTQYTNSSSNANEQIQIYQFPSDTADHDSTNNQTYIILQSNDDLQIADASNNIETLNKKKYRSASVINKMNDMMDKPSSSSSSNYQPASIVPTLSNVDEIFQLLSHKIAKYCQVLADLTNCEAFFKAQLPLSSTTTNILNSNNNKKQNIARLNKRSVYWGTHKMLFQHSHNQGLKYDKQGGDSLIKITQRSLSNDVNNLIEEILNEPNLNLKQIENLNNLSQNLNSNKTSQDINLNSSADSNNNTSLEVNLNEMRAKSSSSLNETYTFTLLDESKLNKKYSKSDIDIKDCCIYLNRLNDSIYHQYLNKFELVNNNIQPNESIVDLKVPNDNELYSEENKANKPTDESKLSITNEESDDEDDDESESDDEKTLLEKNCFSLNDDDLNENDEDFYSCEVCNCSFKHVTQLKMHQLQQHENVNIQTEAPFECSKCKSGGFATRIDYLKHTLLCYYPDIYTCKTCNQTYDNFSQYLFHIRYIHTHVVYMCTLCLRKYRNIKDLLDHDQLMHSKTLNYCEICFEPHKSRAHLYEHYKQAHLNENSLFKKAAGLLDGEHKDSIDSYLTLSEDNQFETAQGTAMNHADNSLKQIKIVGESITTPAILNGEQSQLASLILTESTINNELENRATSDKPKKPRNRSNNILAEELAAGPDEIIQEKVLEWSKVQKNDLIRGLIDRKHQCKWCSLRYYTKTQLKQHEKTHVNSVLVCPVCDKEFAHKDRLSGHMKCHMEPSLECKVCGKKFKRLCNLYNHELVHGLTEHAFMLCQFCGRGFRSRRDYQNHVIANHRDQLMKAEAALNGTPMPSSTVTNPTKKGSNPNGASKRQIKQAKRRINSKNDTDELQKRPVETRIVLTDDHEQIAADNNRNLSIIEMIEPDTYFTRTGTVQLNQNQDVNIESDMDDEDYDENDSNYDENNATSSFTLTDDKSKRNSIRNKFKRIKSSLNIEVIDDDEHSTALLNNQNINYSNTNETQANEIGQTIIHLVQIDDPHNLG